MYSEEPQANYTDLDPWKSVSLGRTLPVRFRTLESKLRPHLSSSACASAFLTNQSPGLNLSEDVDGNKIMV